MYINMNNSKKTYGVYGVIELVAVIPCGKAKMNVSFTGGAQTTYGVTPATFTTEDPFKQLMIENSEMFRNGKIKIYMEAEGTGKYKPLDAGHHKSEDVNVNTAKNGSELSGTTNVESGSTTAGHRKEDEEDDSTTEEHGSARVVEVADIDIARDWLVENYHVSQTALRYKKNVLDFAAEHNVKFVTPEGALA